MEITLLVLVPVLRRKSLRLSSILEGLKVILPGSLRASNYTPKHRHHLRWFTPVISIASIGTSMGASRNSDGGCQGLVGPVLQ